MRMICLPKKLMLGGVCALFFVNSFSQSVNKQRFTTIDGLPSPQVNDVEQDRVGRLWVGTMSGAVYYDGRIFHRLNPENVLYNNPVKAIYRDHRDELWFGTVRKGVVHFNGSSWKNYTTRNGLLSDNVNSVCMDSSGVVWIGTSEGISMMQDGKFKSVTTTSGLVNNNVFDLYCDSKNRVWISTIGGVSVFEKGRFSTFSSSNGLLNNIVYAVREDRQGQIWFATYHGISIWNGADFRNISAQEGLENDQVECLYLTRAGQMWAGTYGGGVVRFSNGKYRSYKPGQDANGNIIKSVLEDREGNYWLATYNGLVRYNGDRFLYYTTENGLSGNNILSSFTDPQGRVWLGTLTNGVSVFSEGTFQNTVSTDMLRSNSVWCISSDTAGFVWLGTSNGPVRFNPKSRTVERPVTELNNLIVYAILQRADGSFVFGTDRGIYWYSNNRMLSIGQKQGLLNDKVRVLYESKDKTLWIGTLKGVYYFQNGQIKCYNDLHSIPKLPVTSMTSDPSGKLIISLYEYGFLSVDPLKKNNKPVTVTESNGLHSRKILFSMFDSRKRLWLGTSGGLELLDWKSFTSNGRIKSIQYDKSNGFPGGETNTATEDSIGNIWFGTVNGAVSYNPDAGDLSSSLPLVSINNIQLFLENVDWTKKNLVVDAGTGLPKDMVLSFRNNHLTFICSAIYLTAPGEVKYRYFLEGFEENWSPPTELGQVSYSNIPPDDYVFKVQASVNGQDWSAPLTYRFRIKAPLWKTPLFYFLYLVFGTGSVVLIYKLRTRTLRRTQDELKRKVDARTRELQDKNLELAKLSLVASETDNAVMIFDEHRELEWVNTGFTKMTGFTLQELKSIRKATLKDLTTNKEVLNYIDDCIRLRRSYIYESEIIHKSGDVKWASSTLTPILNELGQLKNIVVIDTDITLHKKMEEQIRAALEEKGVLLREIHHRVKNNLQIIISLFNLQTSYVSDENAYKALREGQDRIKSMALIHERFYQSDGLSKIDFDEYIKRLAENLMQSFRIDSSKVALKINSEKISLDIDTAVPTGLIINEIVTNSLKHAFKGREHGEIFIELTQPATDAFSLEIRDNGVGFPEGVDPAKLDSLGIQLIHALTQQLEGTMKIETQPGKGVKYIITFKRIS